MAKQWQICYWLREINCLPSGFLATYHVHAYIRERVMVMC